VRWTKPKTFNICVHVVYDLVNLLDSTNIACDVVHSVLCHVYNNIWYLYIAAVVMSIRPRAA